jgi:hypothetical protein
MAEPGAGKMEKADKGAAKPGPAPGEGAVASTERKAALFSLKAAATTIGGGLLTLGFTVAQIAYSDHLAVLQRQNDYGIAFQREFFALSGQIENEMIDVFNLAKGGAPDQADALMRSALHPMTEQWRQVRLWFRVRGAQIYGRRVGELVYDPAEEAVDLDDCAVERPAGQPPGRGDCVPRQRAEADRLAGIIARIRTNRLTGEETSREPASFQSNLRLTRGALLAYVKCLQDAAAAAPAAAPAAGRPCAGLERIVASRLQFMVFAREDISSEIMRSSALRD